MFPEQIISCLYITFDVASTDVNSNSRFKKSMNRHIASSQDVGHTSNCQVTASDWEFSILIAHYILN